MVPIGIWAQNCIIALNYDAIIIVSVCPRAYLVTQDPNFVQVVKIYNCQCSRYNWPCCKSKNSVPKNSELLLSENTEKVIVFAKCSKCER